MRWRVVLLAFAVAVAVLAAVGLGVALAYSSLLSCGDWECETGWVGIGASGVSITSGGDLNFPNSSHMAFILNTDNVLTQSVAVTSTGVVTAGCQYVFGGSAGLSLGAGASWVTATQGALSYSWGGTNWYHWSLTRSVSAGSYVFRLSAPSALYGRFESCYVYFTQGSEPEPTSTPTATPTLTPTVTSTPTPTPTPAPSGSSSVNLGQINYTSAALLSVVFLVILLVKERQATLLYLLIWVVAFGSSAASLILFMFALGLVLLLRFFRP